MLLIPAIDLRQGKCVRLRQGNMDDFTVFEDNPIVAAQRWIDAGARRLHIVDLDGAITGKPVHTEVIHEIVQTFPNTPVQVGGGIRDEDSVEAYIAAGVRYVILGTKAINEPHIVSDLCAEFSGRIIVGLDAKDGKVATDGWSKLSKHDVIDIAQHFESDGVEAIVYTDIERDGMMGGVNIAATASLAEAIRIPVIASGGISKIEDVKAICEVADSGIEAVITGRAIYEGTLDFTLGQKLADEMAAADSAPT